MNRKLGLGIVALALAGCGGPTPTTEVPVAPPEPKLSVVATSAVLCDLVKTVGGAEIDLTCLMAPGVDPHTYQTTPADKRAIEGAAVVFRNGYNFEPAIDQAVAGAKGTVVAVAEVAVPKPLLVAPHDHDHGHSHDHDHSHSHDHGEGKDKAEKVPDPHVWQNPVYGAAMARAIAETLAQVQPAQKENFQQRAQGLQAQLTELQTWQQAQCATIPPAQRVLVTTHHAMGYFAQACGLQALSLAAVSTTDTLSPTQMAAVIEEIREKRVPMLFAEATVAAPWLAQVAREAGVPVATQPLYTDTVGKAGSGAETYVSMLAANVKTVVTGLGGKVAAFPGQAGG